MFLSDRDAKQVEVSSPPQSHRATLTMEYQPVILQDSKGPTGARSKHRMEARGACHDAVEVDLDHLAEH